MGMAKVAEQKLQAYDQLARPAINTTHIKRLTSTEMMARRERGMCYNCDEKFVPGHKCKARFQCMIMDNERLNLEDEVIFKGGRNDAAQSRSTSKFHVSSG
ncbi:hypothetical protein QQ045_021686 [Rhodiola kirilowii]